MSNFFSYDDGLSYYSVSLIESFGHESGGTWIKMKDGTMLHISRPVASVAELLGSANLHY